MRAWSKPPEFPRDVRRLRHRIIDQLEKHPEQWPPACPPLEPIRLAHTFLVIFYLFCFYFYLKLQVRLCQTSRCAHVFFRSSVFSQAEIDSFFQTNNVEHLALIFEDLRSYIGREVTCFLHLKMPIFWFCSIASLLISGITRFSPPCCPSGHSGPAAV